MLYVYVCMDVCICMYVSKSAIPLSNRVNQVTLQNQLLDAATAGRTDEIAQLLEQRDVDIDFKDWVSIP